MIKTRLISPYGGKLVSLVAAAEQQEELKACGAELSSIQISERSACDLEMLACGAFSPLDHFVTKEEHESILEEMRLPSGHLFPIPLPLPVNGDPGLHLDRDIALRNVKNELLGILTVKEIYEWDVSGVSQRVFGTVDPKHPLVAEMQRWGKLNVSGRLSLLPSPPYYDFQDLRLTPLEVREKLDQMGRTN